MKSPELGLRGFSLCAPKARPPAIQSAFSFRYVDRTAGTLHDAPCRQYGRGERIGQLRHMPCAGRRNTAWFSVAYGKCRSLRSVVTQAKPPSIHNTVGMAKGTEYVWGDRLGHSLVARTDDAHPFAHTADWQLPCLVSTLVLIAYCVTITKYLYIFRIIKRRQLPRLRRAVGAAKAGVGGKSAKPPCNSLEKK